MPDHFARIQSRLPIWNAGMGGGLAGPELAAAVSNAGGFGVLGTGASPPPVIHDMIARTRTLTSKPVGANIILPMSDGSDIAAVFDAGVEAIVLFWGDIQPWVADAHKRGMAVVAQCGDGEDASAAADAGADAVIIQGTEAGGHVKALRPLAETLAEARAALGRLPLIAAGGITSGADIARQLAAGARAVSIGSLFLVTEESAALPAYKERLIAAGAADTVMTDLFDIGWPRANHRVIRNQTYEQWEAAGRPTAGARPGEDEQIGEFTLGGTSVPLPRYSVIPPGEGFTGDIDAAALYAGESVEHIHAVESVAAIMARLERELRAAS